MMSDAKHNGVDVVIPTRDRPAQLAATLTALTKQVSGDFGIIVVDDGGAAPAETLVPATVCDVLTIRFLRNESSIGPGPSRNHGVAASAADYVVFLDDDCVAVPEVVDRHRAALTRARGPVVSLGPILSPPGQRLSVWNHWDADRLEREYARLRDKVATPAWTHLYTGNVGVRRKDFVAVGGFDSRFGRQEDVELGYRLDRLGCRFEFDSGASVFHDSYRSLPAWLRIPAASAHFDVLMDRLDPDSDRLAMVKAGLDDKHWALRLLRRIAWAPIGRRWATHGVVGAGRLLHSLRADRAGLAAFSVAWDLTYCEALRDALAMRDHVGVST